jgi:hypothetical protein
MGWWHMNCNLQYLPVKTTTTRRKRCTWETHGRLFDEWHATAVVHHESESHVSLIQPADTGDQQIQSTKNLRPLLFPSPNPAYHTHRFSRSPPPQLLYPNARKTHEHSHETWCHKHSVKGILFCAFFLCEPLFLAELNDEPNKMWERG